MEDETDGDQQLADREAQLSQDVGLLFEPADRWFSAVWLAFTGRGMTLTAAMQPQDVRTFLQLVVRVIARPLLEAVQAAAKCDQARVIECMFHALLPAWPITERTQREAFVTFCQALSGALKTSVPSVVRGVPTHPVTLQARASAFCSDGASAASPGSAAVASPATSTFSSASPQSPQLVVTSSTPHSPADMSSTVEENTTVDAGDRQNGPVPLNDSSSHVVNDLEPVRKGDIF